MSEWTFNALTVLTVSVKLLGFWFVSSGRLVPTYVCMLVVYTGYLGVEGWLWAEQPERWGLGLFLLVNLAGMGAAVRGLRRCGSGKQRDA
jgi:hypothetical protein